MTDWNEKRIDALIKAAEMASQRTRWYFTAIFFASCMMLGSQISLYAPWSAFVMHRVQAGCEAELRKTANQDDKVQELKNDLCKYTVQQLSRTLWVEIYNVTIPVLGVKVNADDLVILGTLGVSWLAVVLWFAQRRECHVISDLCKISNNEIECIDKCQYLYYSVCHHFVLNPTTTNDSTDNIQVESNKFIRLYIKIVSWFPAFACSASLIMLLAIYMLSPVVLQNFLPIDLIPGADKGKSLWESSGTIWTVERMHFLCRMGWGSIMTIVVIYSTWSTMRQLDRTQESLTLLMKNANLNKSS